MARFSNIGLTEGMEDVAYKAVFGDLPNRTCYKHYKPLQTDADVVGKNIDLIQASIEGKEEGKALTTVSDIYATGTSYTATSGSLPVMIPIYLDPQITDRTKFDTPLYNGLIRKVTNRGLFTDFNVMTAKGAAAFKAEDAALTEADDTYERITKPIKFCYAVGRVTGPALAAMAEFVNAQNLEVQNKHQSMAEKLERQICQGTNIDSTGFEGFYDWVTTNTTDLSNTTVTVDDLRTAIQTATEATTSRGTGHPDLFVTDLKTLNDIKKLFQNELRYINIPEGRIAWGIRTIEFEGIPIITSPGMSTTAAAREIHLWDTSVAELRILQDETFEELAKTHDSYKFMIKWYGCMVIKAEVFCYRIYGGA